MSLRVAIHPDDYGEGNASAPRWRRYLEEHGVEVVEVDARRPDIIEQLAGCQGFMWRFAQYSNHRQIALRLIPVMEQALGLEVYPDLRTCWHYDDKIAQAHLFAALQIPHPKTWAFFDRDGALEWVAGARFPVVLKLATGAGSSNVRLIDNVSQARRWVRLLFGAGVSRLDEGRVPGPALRVLRAGAELALGRGLYSEKYWDRHKNYALFQQFLPGNSGDTRITVVGQRAFGFRRQNRPGDFRASGSGRIDLDPAGVDLRFVKLGFEVARKLGMQSVAIDGLYDGEGRPMVGEVSYTYVSSAVQSCPGHFRPDLSWVSGQMWPEQAQAEDYLARLAARFGAP